MVNVDKLRGKMVERRMPVPILAKKMGIDTSTFYRKLGTGGETFSIKEVDAMVRELNLDRNTATDIFFTQEVADMRM